jgi:alkylhydroperoxidase family enzyme
MMGRPVVEPRTIATPLRFDFRNRTVRAMTASVSEAPRIAPADTALPEMGPPINLFKVFARNLPMARAMTGWGRYELSRDLTLSMRRRELVIDRVTARCGAEYEWGVHVAFFAERVGLTRDQITSLTHGSPLDPCWPADERTLLNAVDELHDTNDVSDATWGRLDLTDEQRLDLLLLTGWYHAISYVARAARVPLEPGAPRFADY